MTGAWFDTLGVFDLETTGVDVETSRVVSAHVGLIDRQGADLESSLWLADPGIEIPAQASAVHGITTERARAEGRNPVEVIAEIIASLQAIFERGVGLVVYNAPYDLTLLNREARRYGLVPLSAPAPIVDPLVIDRAVDPYRKGKRTLELAAEFYGVDLTDAHDAGADAIAAGRVAQAIGRRYRDRLPATAAELHQLQIAWCHDQAISFQNFMRRERDPRFTAATGWPQR